VRDLRSNTLIDTHCHIHESDYPLGVDEVIGRAKKVGVGEIICVGTNVDDSKLALGLAKKYDNVFASIGVHPHHANHNIDGLDRLVVNTKVVAIGEIGLDYHYDDEPSHKKQIELLEAQINLALEHDLPIIFHVREAYDDFWKVLDDLGERSKKIRGVLHSFTDSADNLEKGLRRGFYISINGISTFTHDRAQKEMYGSIPLDRLLLETDAPLLTPYPLRGKIKINEPAFVREVAEHIGNVHHLSLDEIAKITTKNARTLFDLK
jgi:TatD DNase family protein